MSGLVLGQAEFELLRDYIHEQAGIALGPSKRLLLESRLRSRVQELGLPSFLQYYKRVVADASGQEAQDLVDRVTTQTTAFFREPAHFELLARHVLPGWLAEPQGPGLRRLRLWSAACSTGQEVYSMAAVVNAVLRGRDDVDVKILATDVSSRALARAEAAQYPAEEWRALPLGWRRGFQLWDRGSRCSLRVAPELRALVAFRWLNLLENPFPFSGRFDVIFCRNVFIYFDDETRRSLLERLMERLQPGGFLFLGMAEALVRIPKGLSPVVPSVYRRAGMMRGA